MTRCSHLGQVRDVTPNTDGCEECLKTGDEWVHLRLCRVCGHVGCCDSSKNRRPAAGPCGKIETGAVHAQRRSMTP